MTEFDVFIAGGGLAGLTAAARLASEGFAVMVVDAAGSPQGAGDLRTTAFLGGSIDTLRRAGVWEALGPSCEALWTMKIIDAGGAQNAVRDAAAFDADEMGDTSFGWNATNSAARAALEARLAALGVARRAPVRVTGLTAREDAAFIRLGDGETIRATLVLAADGRDSFVRRACGIGATRHGYGQRALVFCVSHPRPHGGVSTEIHRSGGPFTLVPMPDGEDGRHRSSVVWMERTETALALEALDADAFAEAVNARALGVLGRLTPEGPRGAFPMIAQIAHRLSARRVALMAEAAHVIPPIGAQGLNMSLADLEALTGLLVEARAAGRDMGGDALLTRYHRARWPEMAARVAGVDALNRAARAEARPLRDLRALALGAVGRIGPARRLAMRLGMGARG